MNEILKEVTVKEMGSRFARIRQRLQLSQQQVADMLNISQTRVSFIEKGENSLSPIFLSMALFYMQHVSAESLFARKFDIDEPHLFDKDYTSPSVAKRRLELFKKQIRSEMIEKIDEWDKRIDSTIDYL